MAQHDDRRPADTVLFGAELAAENRLDAERRKEVPGDRGPVEALRLLLVGEREAPTTDCGDLLERVRARPPILQIEI